MSAPDGQPPAHTHRDESLTIRGCPACQWLGRVADIRRIADLEAEVARLAAENTLLRDRIAELEDQRDVYADLTASWREGPR